MSCARAKSRLRALASARTRTPRNRRARRIARGRLLGPGEPARSFRAGALARSAMEASLDVGAGSVPGEEIGPHSDAERVDETRTESRAQDAGAAGTLSMVVDAPTPTPKTKQFLKQSGNTD